LTNLALCAADGTAMRKESKAALAAGAAVLLLLSGEGTFAVWSDTTTITGGAINAGRMALVTDTTNTGCGSWQLDTGEAPPSTYTVGNPLVPGDVLTKQCKFTIQAVGNHLRAGVGISSPTFNGTSTNFGGNLTADVTNIKVNGSAATSFTDDNNGQPLVATVTVTFNGTANNTTQNMSSALADLTLTTTQVHS
jgi:alternate signal-mediated exported protein